tara:strand:+ start:159 stop:1916 length:1758 start_codon:yes stop_codon:yes gene_type:complete
MNRLNAKVYTIKKNMNKLLLTTLMLALVNLTYSHDSKKTASDTQKNTAIKKARLNEATVYTSGVQLRSSLKYNAIKGLNEIIVEGISPSIDPQTVQVSATGNAIILDSKYSVFYPTKSIQENNVATTQLKRGIKLLNDSIESKGYELRRINESIAVYKEAKSILHNNGMVKNKGKVNDSIDLLKEIIEFYAVKMNKMNEKILDLSKHKNSSQKGLNQMKQRLGILNEKLRKLGQSGIKQDPVPRITISLIAEVNTSGEISLSYLSKNAGWTPLYDIRSKSSEGKIFMNYKAQVHQTTGLDWKNIKLNISTNNPYANKTKPELNPWYISYKNYRKELNVRSDNNQLYKMTTAPSRAITNMGYSYKSENIEDEAINANEFTTLTQQLTAAEFKIDLPYNIISNGEKHMVLVQKSELETNFKYYAVPKLDVSVYLVAEMLKIDELQLIPSKANIFFDGTYVGETFIDPTTMNDTLYLSLGKDPNIAISRKLISSKCKEKIIGDKIEKHLAYSIEIKNMKSSQVEVVIQDQIPITTNSDIIIDKINAGKGKLKARTGLIEWKTILKSKEQKTYDFDYRIKFNKDKQINI